MKKIDKEDWYSTGLQILETDGFSKITIENLCTKLKITKGSFYHHFKNIEAYIEALMNYWVDKNTVSFIEKADQISDPQKREQELNQMVLERSHACEQVIRGWSFSNETVRKYVTKVDELRMNYTAALKELCGIKPEAARQLAILEYASLIGIQQLYPTMPIEKQKELYNTYVHQTHKNSEL